MRTVFNLLGPLVNPARLPTRSCRRVYCARGRVDGRRLGPVGHEARIRRARTGRPRRGEHHRTTIAFQVEVGSVNRLTWNASDFGLPTARHRRPAGGESPENAGILRSILQGDPGPRRDIVLANAAAALLAAQKVATLREGVAAAVDSIDSGAAAAKLEALRLYAPSHVT